MTDRGKRLLRAELGATAGLVLAGAVAQRRHLRRIASDPEQAVLATPPQGRPLEITSADGTRLHAEVFGPEQGHTFVLAHGWTETLGYWIYVIRELAGHGYRVVAYDLRGHGQSEPAAAGDYAVARFGEDLEAVLEAALPDGQRAIVVGHSLGAMSVAAWAEHFDVERRACAAGLLNTGVGELLAESLLIPLPALANFLNRVAPTALIGSRAKVLKFSTPISHASARYVAFGPSATPAQIAFYERMLIACPPDVRADVGLAISEIDLYHALPRLTVPTLVLAGSNDRLTPPSHAKRIAEALPNLEQLVVLERTGHMAPLERHEEVVAALVGLAQAGACEPAIGAVA
jgi:pimeloyl-ACP methyl ester carboxylesterase